MIFAMSDLIFNMFGFFPPWFIVIVQISFVVVVVLLVLKILALIWDALPFV